MAWHGALALLVLSFILLLYFRHSRAKSLSGPVTKFSGSARATLCETTPVGYRSSLHKQPRPNSPSINPDNWQNDSEISVESKTLDKLSVAEFI